MQLVDSLEEATWNLKRSRKGVEYGGDLVRRRKSEKIK